MRAGEGDDTNARMDVKTKGGSVPVLYPGPWFSSCCSPMLEWSEAHESSAWPRADPWRVPEVAKRTVSHSFLCLWFVVSRSVMPAQLSGVIRGGIVHVYVTVYVCVYVNVVACLKKIIIIIIITIIFCTQ